MKIFLKKALAFFTSIVTAGLVAVSTFSVSAEELRNGDTNGDGKVDLHDVINICKHVLKNPLLPEEYMQQADYNKDDKVNIHDAIFISRLIINQAKINDVVALINYKRKIGGVSPLTLDYSLVDASMKYSAELPSKIPGSMRPDDMELIALLSEYDVDYTVYDNCVAAGLSTASKLCDEIMKKSDKRKMLLSSEFSKIGVGYCNHADKYNHYWTILLI